ncbi:unnamed protein product [Gongylonema pulchrum]|uniref:SH2 domain-containing protein n=1 Tax=Gongylonema pulchrum TaxID=637853 RepID=A0A183DV01_9BILA|nr:unnamed protein product [Gongylonema pulchrum]
MRVFQTMVNKIDRLPLVVVYRSSCGHNFHWLVRTMGDLTENPKTKQNEFKIRSYYIEHGGPTLPSLSELIKSYENRTYSMHGYVDVFCIS